MVSTYLKKFASKQAFQNSLSRIRNGVDRWKKLQKSGEDLVTFFPVIAVNENPPQHLLMLQNGRFQIEPTF